MGCHSVPLVLLVALATVCHSVSAGLPLYFGFYPGDSATEQGLKQLARDTIAEVLSIDEVRRLYCQFTNHSLDTPVANLTAFAYANPTDDLHVTSFYCNYGQVPSCAGYAASPEVRAAVNRSFAINVTAIMLTPRTFGYRVQLGPDALEVWANGEGESVKGQRAHFTVATSPGVSAVQTGLDLLAIVKQVGRPINNSRVLDYQSGQFLVLLNRPVPAVFRPSDAGKGDGALRPAAALAAVLLALVACALGI